MYGRLPHPNKAAGAGRSCGRWGEIAPAGRGVKTQHDCDALELAGPYQNNNTGGIVLLRRNDDGTPDTTFGTGVVYASIVNNYGSDTAIARQRDGKIVFVGANDSPWDFIVARYETYEHP